MTNFLKMESESLIIRRAIDGDERALRALWTRHAPHIDMVVRRLVGGDTDTAADIAQEVWIQIFRALPSYRGDSQFSTWAHRIAVNRTLNALRKTKRLSALETEVQENSAAVDPDHDRSWSGSTAALSSCTSVSRVESRRVLRSALSVRFTAIRCAHVLNCESPR